VIELLIHLRLSYAFKFVVNTSVVRIALISYTGKIQISMIEDLRSLRQSMGTN
jgi:hypothetical protein